LTDTKAPIGFLVLDADEFKKLAELLVDKQSKPKE
jgi:hypothetical protein